MEIPFSVEQFYGVFRDYNIAVWPVYAFTALSLAGSATFFWQGVNRRRLTFKWTPGLPAMAGAALIVPPDLGLVAAAAVGMCLLISAGRRRQAAPS